jgi:tetraspanin-33
VFWLIGSILLALGIFVLVETKDFYKELADLAFQPSIIFFFVGAIIFIITFIGCLGSLRENTCLLGAYSIILTVILLLVLACGVVGFVYKDSVERKVVSSLKKAIVFYRDSKREDLQNLIDLTQIELKCCGAISYDDWDANRYFNCSATAGSAESCGVPYSCCLADLQFNRQCGYGIRKPGVTLTKKKRALTR